MLELITCEIPTTNIAMERHELAWKVLREFLNASVRRRRMKY
jgi:hypothetical protein